MTRKVFFFAKVGFGAITVLIPACIAGLGIYSVLTINSLNVFI